MLYLPGFMTFKSLFWNLIAGIGFLLFWFLISSLLFRWTKSRFLEKTANIKVLSNVGVFCVLLGLVLFINIASYQLNPSRVKDSRQIIILLVDALRADHLSCYGYHRTTTPHIDAFAQDAAIFTQAISQSTFTKMSIASLFTSRYPYQHQVYSGNRRDTKDNITSDVLAEEEITLAEILSQNGYLTTSWIHNSYLKSYMGFSQSFIEYNTIRDYIKIINIKFINWLDMVGRNYRFFTYIHYIDLHDPYKPKPPYDRLYGVYSDL